MPMISASRSVRTKARAGALEQEGAGGQASRAAEGAENRSAESRSPARQTAEARGQIKANQGASSPVSDSPSDRALRLPP